jgi:hypothetical protein
LPNAGSSSRARWKWLENNCLHRLESRAFFLKQLEQRSWRVFAK